MSSSGVLLGIKEEMIIQVHSTSWKTNKIGGDPDWMPNCTPVTNIPKCQLCERRMALAVQVYCPLGTSPYDRTLYVFCCINQMCWNKQGSWQAYRIQHLPHEQNVKEETSCLKEETWLAEELDWDSDDDNINSNNAADIVMNSDIPECNIVTGPNRTEAETTYFTDDVNPLAVKLLEISRATAENLPCQPSETQIIPPNYSPLFKSFFISVVEEPPIGTGKDFDRHVQQLLDSYQGKEFQSESHTEIASGAETYEKTCANHGDRIFQKFVNRVARCQEQVIRYCWKGEPLLMRKETFLLTCQYCHGPVAYELQLMPALVNFLKLQNVENEDVAVEFGTVLIFTCQSSCWEENTEYRVENVCIQSDPDEDLFQQRL